MPDPWYLPFLPALPTVIIAIAGFWIAHWLSVRRQRREESHRYYQGIVSLLRDVTAEACEAWTSPDADRRRALAEPIPARIDLLARKVHHFEKRAGISPLFTPLHQFRVEATEGLHLAETTPLPERGRRIRMAANRLEETLDEVFLERFG